MVRIMSIFILVLATVLSACAKDTIENRRFGQEMICHNDKETLTVSNADSFMHLQHGDSPGPCPEG
jgi:hypothetical protein